MKTSFEDTQGNLGIFFDLKVSYVKDEENR